MKKKKQKSAVKESKQLAKKELTSQLIDALKSVAVNFTDHKKAEKLINKSAKQLAKKLVLELPIKVANVETPTPVTTNPVQRKKVTKKEEISA